MDRTKLMWMRKLALSTNYVLLTDDESVINIKKIDLTDFANVQVIANQQASLERFRHNLTKLITDYEKALNKVVGTTASTTKKKVTKIPVKNG